MMICNCLLIETRGGLVLVDTGLGLDDVDDPEGRLGRLPSTLFRIERDPTRTAIRQLKALGFQPSHVQHIVMTHLDFDNAGGLPDFPSATVHVLDLEHDSALHPRTLLERNRYSQAQFAHGPNWQTHTVHTSDKWFGFENIRPLMDFEPDILMIPLFGHSNGHCGVAVQDESGWVFHVGDAVFHPGELEQVEPGAPVGIQIMERMLADDWNLAVSSQSLLRQLVHDQFGSVRVVCSHDPGMMEAIPPAAPVRVSAYVG
jgi:glyoxylase-like metal-dependent hydrolase (beta-lactamase superfamily II)